MFKKLLLLIMSALLTFSLSACSVSEQTSPESSAVSLTASSTDYILPFSSTRKVQETDLSQLSQTELNYAQYEITARHGVIFADDNLQQYFSSKSWYIPKTEASQFNLEDLSDIERENYVFIHHFITQMP